MEIFFSAIADEKYKMDDLCSEFSSKLNKRFLRKQYTLAFSRISICFVCVSPKKFEKFKSRFNSNTKQPELYVRADARNLGMYRNLDLKLYLGYIAIERIQNYIRRSKYQDFRIKDFLIDFVLIYSKEILLNKYFLQPSNVVLVPGT
jgi:hypothetical protein